VKPRLLTRLSRPRDPFCEQPERLREQVECDLWDAGLRGRVIRVFPPYDSDDDVEVLLVGSDGAPYTVYLRPDVEGAARRVVEAGW
jgi:hypothetical protein